ncbi:hypothetical protein [Ornithobacterium rhinotracheale]
MSNQENNSTTVNNSNEVQKSKGELLMEWADLLDGPEQMAQDLESFLNVVIHLFLEEKECQMYRESIGFGRYYLLELCEVLRKKNLSTKDLEKWLKTSGEADFMAKELRKFLDNAISIYLNNDDSYMQQRAICDGRYYVLELIKCLS